MHEQVGDRTGLTVGFDQRLHTPKARLGERLIGPKDELVYGRSCAALNGGEYRLTAQPNRNGRREVGRCHSFHVYTARGPPSQ